jgi:hypothetical protein
MAIIHKWETGEDAVYTETRFGNEVCSLSGKPLDPRTNAFRINRMGYHILQEQDE